MRVLGDIPHPDFKVTLFAWNGKYILKIEQGLLEQTYKVSELEVTGTEDIKDLLDDIFWAEVSETFNRMHQTLMSAFIRSEA